MAQEFSLSFSLALNLAAMAVGCLQSLNSGCAATTTAAPPTVPRGTTHQAIVPDRKPAAREIAAVFALGALVLCASVYLVPEPLRSWVRSLCGMVVVGHSGLMLFSLLTASPHHHEHREGVPEPVWNPGGRQAIRTLRLTSAFSEKILPRPAASLVLLTAFALGRMVPGLLLIAAYSLGVAVAPLWRGVWMASVRRGVVAANTRARMTGPWLLVASTALITALGVMVACQGLALPHLQLSAFFQDLTRNKVGPLLYVIGLGLLLGMRHSTDADHVVAISTIVSKQRGIGAAAFIGSVWGIGHTITIFLVGSLIILFGVEIPPRLGLSMEFCVAVMLVLLGVLNLTGVIGWVTRRYTPGAASLAEAPPAKSPPAGFSEHLLQRTVGRFGAFQFVRPLIIGLVHGLAGSAAVALLVLSTIHDPVWATFYLLVFGAGTLVGMMCMTAALAVPFTYAHGRFLQLSRYLNYASGLASLGFGSFLVYRLGYVSNLFGSHPVWTPQ